MSANKNPRAGGTAQGAQETTHQTNDSTPARLPRAARRALARYERKGCAVCGGRTPFVTIGMKGKRWLAMCEVHTTQLDEVYGAGVAVFGEGGLIETAETPWGTEDRAWFAAHPDRSHRIREVLPGEFPDLGTPPSALPVYVVVRQVQPGFRVRWPVGWTTRLDDPPEAWCHALYDLCDRHETGVITSAEVNALASAYATSGSVQ